MTQKLLHSIPLRVNRCVYKVCLKTEQQQLAAGLKTSIFGKPFLGGTLFPQGYQRLMHPFLPALQTERSQEVILRWPARNLGCFTTFLLVYFAFLRPKLYIL